MRPTDIPYMRNFVRQLRDWDEGSCRPDALERVLDRVAELEAERERVLDTMRDGPDMDGDDPVVMVRALGLLYISAVQERQDAEARVAELEAAAKPRPMSEAPCHRVLLQSHRGDWSVADPSSLPPSTLARMRGWLSLPDERRDDD